MKFFNSITLLVLLTSCTLNAPNAKLDANVDQSNQKGNSSNSSSGTNGNNSNPQQIVVNVNNNPNINTNINPNISNNSSNSSTTNNTNNQNSPTNNNPTSSPTTNTPTDSNPVTGNQDNTEKKYKIIYTKDVPSSTDRSIYSVNIDGSLNTLLNKGELYSYPIASRDGSKILFKSMYELLIMNKEGTGKISLTKGEFLHSGSSSFSMDNKKIFYNDVYSKVYSINLDGTQKESIFNESEYKSYSSILSNDGKYISFISNESLKIVGVDGIGQTQITNKDKIIVTNSNLSWSNDSKSILFSGYIPGEKEQNIDIYRINIDGTNLTRLTESPAIEEYPSLSPDGKYITFKKAHSLNTLNSDLEVGIALMNSDGKDQKVVVSGMNNNQPSFILVQ